MCYSPCINWRKKLIGFLPFIIRCKLKQESSILKPMEKITKIFSKLKHLVEVRIVGIT